MAVLLVAQDPNSKGPHPGPLPGGRGGSEAKFEFRVSKKIPNSKSKPVPGILASISISVVAICVGPRPVELMIHPRRNFCTIRHYN